MWVIFSLLRKDSSCWVFSRTLITDDKGRRRGREARIEAGDEVVYKAGRSNMRQGGSLEIDFPISLDSDSQSSHANLIPILI